MKTAQFGKEGCMHAVKYVDRNVQFSKERHLSLVEAEGRKCLELRKRLTPSRKNDGLCTEMIEECLDCKTLSIRAPKYNKANSLENFHLNESPMKKIGFV